jgi:hypothetical protein
MAVRVEYGLAEGLRYAEDSRTGQISYTVIADCYDLDPVGGGSPFGTAGQELALILQALSMVPARLSVGPIAGTYLLNREPVIDPHFPADCRILLHYGIPQPGTAGGATRIRIGTTLDRGETEFDAANRALPFASRVPIEVVYDSANTTPGANAVYQGGRVPALFPKSTVIYTRSNSYDPSGESRTYAGKTNSVTWKGLAVGTVLCLEIFGESTDGGATFVTDYALAYDPDDGFMQYLRYIDPLTGKPPKLTAAYVNARNGITDIAVQGSADFNSLGL